MRKRGVPCGQKVYRFQQLESGNGATDAPPVRRKLA
jgi:hypothetical protein